MRGQVVQLLVHLQLLDPRNLHYVQSHKMTYFVLVAVEALYLNFSAVAKIRLCPSVAALS